jgi:hypothetical protein
MDTKMRLVPVVVVREKTMEGRCSVNSPVIVPTDAAQF